MWRRSFNTNPVAKLKSLPSRPDNELVAIKFVPFSKDSYHAQWRIIEMRVTIIRKTTCITLSIDFTAARAISDTISQFFRSTRCGGARFTGMA